MGEGQSRDLGTYTDAEAPPASQPTATPSSSVPTSSSLLEASLRGNLELVTKLLKKGKKVNKKDAIGETALHKAAKRGHLEIVQQLLKRGADTTATDLFGQTPFHLAVINARIGCAKLIADENPAVLTTVLPINPFNAEYSIITRSGKLFWTIGNFSKLDDRKVYSTIFQISGCRWQLVLYPKGSKGDENLSVYVEVADHERLPDYWGHLTNFSFVILNQITGEKKITREVVAHRFYKTHTDLGFPSIVKKNVLQNRKSGCVVRDKLQLEFVMQVIDTNYYPVEDMVATYTWRMPSVSSAKERVTSPTFIVGGCQWMIAVYPKGKSGGNNLSVYLKVADASTMPESSWFYLVNFRFSLINHIDGSKFTRHVESKNFRHKVEDWGFPLFMKLTKVYNPDVGYLVDDTLTFELELEILDKYQPQLTSATATATPTTAQSPSPPPQPAATPASVPPLRHADRLQPFSVNSTIKHMRLTALHWACYSGAIEGVKELLARQVTINARDRRGRTPLDWAACRGFYEVVTLLFQHGADANTRDKEGFSPLHKAVLNGHIECVCVLLEHNANVDAIPPAARERRKSNTAQPQSVAIMASTDTLDSASAAVSQDQTTEPVVDQDRDYYAELVAKDIPLTPLHLALRSVHPNTAQILRVLIDVFCADVNIPDLKGRSPLHYAASAGDLGLTELLLSHGAMVDAQDCDGNTPLHKAIWKGNLHIVECLVIAGADVLLRNGFGYSAVHSSVLLNDLRCLQLLINLTGVAPSAEDGDSYQSSPASAGVGNFNTSLSQHNKRRESDVVDTDYQPPKKTNIRLPFEPKTGTEAFDLANRHSRIKSRPLDPNFVEAVLGGRLNQGAAGAAAATAPRQMADDELESSGESSASDRRTRHRRSTGEVGHRPGLSKNGRSLDDNAIRQDSRFRRTVSSGDMDRHVQINAPLRQGPASPPRSAEGRREQIRALRKSDPLLMDSRPLLNKRVIARTESQEDPALSPPIVGSPPKDNTQFVNFSSSTATATTASTAPVPQNLIDYPTYYSSKKLKAKVSKIDTTLSALSSAPNSPTLGPGSPRLSPPTSPRSPPLSISEVVLENTDALKKEKPVLRKSNSLLELRNKLLPKKKPTATSTATGADSSSDESATTTTPQASPRPRALSPTRATAVNFRTDEIPPLATTASTAAASIETASTSRSTNPSSPPPFSTSPPPSVSTQQLAVVTTATTNSSPTAVAAATQSTATAQATEPVSAKEKKRARSKSTSLSSGVLARVRRKEGSGPNSPLAVEDFPPTSPVASTSTSPVALAKPKATKAYPPNVLSTSPSATAATAPGYFDLAVEMNDERTHETREQKSSEDTPLSEKQKRRASADAQSSSIISSNNGSLSARSSSGPRLLSQSASPTTVARNFISRASDAFAVPWKRTLSGTQTKPQPAKYPIADLINVTNKKRITPLHTAVRHGNVTVASFLIKMGAQLNAKSADHSTPLDWATFNRDAPMTVFLLEQGATLSSKAKHLLQFVSQRVPPVRIEEFNSGKSSFSDDMRTLFNNATYSDVIFVVESKPIHAWKGILCARSEFFRAMFFSHLRESAERKIEITDVSYSTFYRVIEYIYTDNLDQKSLSVDEALNILGVANRYILERLKKLVERFLFHSIDDENVYSIFQAADLYEASAVRSACVLYIATNCDRILNVTEVVNHASFRASVKDFLHKTIPNYIKPR